MIQAGQSFIVDFADVPDDWEILADAVYRGGEGFLTMGFKHRGTGDWHDETFEWPQAHQDVEREIARRVGDGWDVYACSNLMKTRDRRKGNAGEVWALSFELDARPANPLLLHQLKAVRVASGTPDHEHVYVLLAETIDVARANQLTKTIAKAVSPHVSKFEDNGLLRVPDTKKLQDRPASTRASA